MKTLPTKLRRPLHPSFPTMHTCCFTHTYCHVAALHSGLLSAPVGFSKLVSVPLMMDFSLYNSWTFMPNGGCRNKPQLLDFKQLMPN